MDDFGRYLRRLRLDRDLTLKQVEMASGVSNAYISQLERGSKKSPHPDILKGLAKAYRLPVEDLLRAAGYLETEPTQEKTREEVDKALALVKADPQVQHGTRLKGSSLSLEAKRLIIELYEKATNRRLL